MPDDTLARLFWSRVETSGSVPAQMVKRGGRWEQHDILTWDALRRIGREQAWVLGRLLIDRVASTRAEDIATIVYTSGTTGIPKGVIQTHGNHMASLCALAQIPGVEPGDVHLLFLPLAHSFARLEAFMGVHRGLVSAFAESLEKLVRTWPRFAHTSSSASPGSSRRSTRRSSAA